jgi:outer membrane immunogenic protein
MTSANTARARSPRAVKTFALLAVAVTAGLGTTARAADLPEDFFELRGPISGGVRWDGFQVGGHVGYVNSQNDFGHATRETVETLMNQTTLEFDSNPPSEWEVLGKGSATGMSYGGFIGYNWQLDSIVVGIDAAYNYTGGITSSASGDLGPGRRVTTSDGGVWDVNIRGRSALTLHDYATLRARVGYPMGQFLPYAFVGGAVGRFDYRTRTTAVMSQGAARVRLSEVQTKEGAFTAGVAGGLGVDIALLPNMYLRAEYEFIGFAEIAGIRPTVHTGRVGLGFRF